MGLNKQRKEELRKNILEQLKNVPEGSRIHLDKNLLEDLLFEKVVIVESKGLTVKLPVWSGEFLRKIDLSEINFKNVSWTLSHDAYYVEGSDKLSEKEELEAFEKLSENDRYTKNKNYIIDYSYTNANIDLTESFEFMFDNNIAVDYCDFEGLNFGNQDLSKCKSIHLFKSNISNAKINIPSEIKLFASYSDLSNINLTGRSIDGVRAIFDEGGYNMGDCNLSNTGVEIDFDIIEYVNYIEKYKEEYENKKYNKKLVEAKNKNWVGCFVNGKKIEKHLSKEEKELEQRKKENPGKFFEIGSQEYEIFTSFDSPYDENKRFIIFTDNKFDLKGNTRILFGKYNKSVGLKPIDKSKNFDPIEPLENEQELHFVEKKWLDAIYGDDIDSKKRI